jgi:hypothetical protein
MGQLVVELPFGVDPEVMELEVRTSPDEAEVSHRLEFDNRNCSWGNGLEWNFQIDTPYARPEAKDMGSIGVRGSIEPEIKSDEDGTTIFDFTQTEPLAVLLKNGIAEKRARVSDDLTKETTELAIDKRWRRISLIASAVGGVLMAKGIISRSGHEGGATDGEVMQSMVGFLPFIFGGMSGMMRDSLVRMRRRRIVEDTTVIARLDEVTTQLEANGVTILSNEE